MLISSNRIALKIANFKHFTLSTKFSQVFIQFIIMTQLKAYSLVPESQPLLDSTQHSIHHQNLQFRSQIDSFQMNKSLDSQSEGGQSLQETLVESKRDDQKLINKSMGSEIKKQQEDTKRPKPKHIKKSFARLFAYTWKYKGMLLVANIGMMVSALGMVVLPYLAGEMIDDIKNQTGLLDHAIQLLLLTLVLAVFTSLRGYFFNLLGEKVMLDLRTNLFNRLIEKDINYYDVNKSGELVSRLTSDIGVVQSAASDNLSILLRSLVQFVGSLVFLWFISWKLTLFILVSTAIFLVFIFFIIKSMKKYKRLYQDNLAKANARANEVFGNIRVVKSFSTQINEQKHYADLISKTYEVGRKQACLYSVMLFMLMIFANGLVLSVLYFGGQMVMDEQITIGLLTSYVLYTITMTAGLATVAGIVNQIVSALGVCEKIFEIMDAPIEVINGTYKYDGTYKNGGTIEFKDVCFSYPTKKQVKVMKGINLSIFNGESLALVGSSGSGKSSLVSLILRFYDIESGSLSYDGTELKDYDLPSLRKSIGYVSQEPTLFSGTLKENIIYGLDEQPSPQAINKALQMANAKDFVFNKQMFPDGLDTVVGERGIKLSGGQKQRIAIARCVIKDPKILIFDEATSALDAESEYFVQKAIDGLLAQKDRTIIIIAHRLSTIITCDRIVVIKDGVVAEQGKHYELLQNNGVYKALIEKQISGLQL